MKHNHLLKTGKRQSRFWVGGTILAMLAFLIAGPATAATAAPADGWVRLAHMSPDTGAVNGSLTTLAGKTLIKFDSLKYGAVSKYVKLAAGSYTLQMQPSSGGLQSPVLVSETVKVTAGQAKTIMAYNLNADLKIKTISDSLQAPASGKARVKVVHAAAQQTNVTAKTGTTTLLNTADPGKVSAYKSLSAGIHQITLTRGSTTVTDSVNLKAGSLDTIFVVTNSSDKLTLIRVTDSTASALVPTGALGAGGGYLAMQQQASQNRDLALLLALVAGLGVGATVLVRRRQTTR